MALLHFYLFGMTSSKLYYSRNLLVMHEDIVLLYYVICNQLPTSRKFSSNMNVHTSSTSIFFVNDVCGAH